MKNQTLIIKFTTYFQDWLFCTLKAGFMNIASNVSSSPSGNSHFTRFSLNKSTSDQLVLQGVIVGGGK
jgi:hypothetical protein